VIPAEHPESFDHGNAAAMSVRQNGFSVYDDQKVGNEDASWSVPLTIKFKDASGIHELQTLRRPGTGKVELPSHGKVEWAYPMARNGRVSDRSPR
jgi:hypothetical protein